MMRLPDARPNHVWCHACAAWIPQGPGLQCRHLYPTPAGWAGAGASPGRWQQSRCAFHAMLDATGLADELRQAVETGRYQVAYLLGDGGQLRVHFTVYGGDPLRARFLGGRFHEAREPGTLEQVEAGVRWLMSLDKERTPEANAATLRWLDEWAARRPVAAAQAVQMAAAA